MTNSADANSKQQALDRIALVLSASSPCPLRAGATHAVPGEGNPNAGLFFIGEAPGKNEDLTGRPFVGAAGKILTDLLATIDLKREDVFITSIEKFRPPDNRVPKPQEIMACFPVLEEQIAVIEPKLIVTLGRHALRRMLEWENDIKMKAPPSMDEYRGKIFVGPKGHTFFPIHHPAAALYSRKLLPTLQADFKEIARLLKTL